MVRLLSGAARSRTVPGRSADDVVTAPRRVELDPDPTGRVPTVDAGGDPVVPAGDGAPGGGGHFGRSLNGPGARRRSGLDLRNSWQVVAGSILVPLGIVIIILAWYGSAHTRYVQQQIPYLVSGSFIGLGLMVLGGLLYWAHWLYRMFDQADLHHEELMEALDRSMRAGVDRTVPTAVTFAPGVGSGAVGSGAAGSGTGWPGDGVPQAAEATPFVATVSGTVFHLPSCPVAGHHGEGLRALGPGEAAGMDPCGICRPGGAPGPA